MSSSDSFPSRFSNCNCDDCNNEQLFLYKSLLETSDTRYENFYLRLSNFDGASSFSSGFFNDSGLSSQVFFHVLDKSRNAFSESYLVPPSSESFRSRDSLPRALVNYSFDNSSDSNISKLEYTNIPTCEYLDDNPSFYCDLCNYPTFDCVCCWYCHYPPIECTCGF
ncbi:13883_t:CDS:2 [Gigaspora rosea]|nr:13883_t:CDS:2 [Gigaspora rosea]